MSIEQKITKFAEHWLKQTGKESLFLIQDLQGYDYSIDCYNSLSDKEKESISDTEFLDLLEKKINQLF